jgi:hypothetical protein
VSPRTAAGGRTETETKHSSCCAVARKRLGPSRGPRERLPRQPPRSAPRGRDTPTTPQAREPRHAFRLRAKRSTARAPKQKEARRPRVFLSLASLSLSLEKLSLVRVSKQRVKKEDERENKRRDRVPALSLTQKKQRACADAKT